MRIFSAVGGFLLVVGLAFGAGWWARGRAVPTPAAIAAIERSVDLLELELTLLRPRHERARAALAADVDTAWLPARAIIERYRDSVYVPTPFVVGLAQAGDRVVNSCRRADSTCAELVATERARGDSLDVEAAAWRDRARGPLLAITGGFNTDPGDPLRGLAGELELGLFDGTVYGRLSRELLSDSATTELRVGVRRPIRLF